MDQSCSESDVSMSPSQILERLQMLRQLQLMQRGKLQKQRLEYQESTESSSIITEMISHFTNSATSTSYNTFRSLLQSPPDDPDSSPRVGTNDISPKILDEDLLEGVSVLNLSQESEFVATSPVSGTSKASAVSKQSIRELTNSSNNHDNSTENIKLRKKHITLDEMPILSPRKSFESLIVEKLKSDQTSVKTRDSIKHQIVNKKRPFLRRGEGMARFGLKKNDLIIQNTKSLPWKKRNMGNKSLEASLSKSEPKDDNKLDKDNIIVPDVQLCSKQKAKTNEISDKTNIQLKPAKTQSPVTNHKNSEYDNSECSIHSQKNMPVNIIQMPKGKHPLLHNKGKTWASVLTKEQNDFLSQLKQSDYYKNFASPAKSTISEVSCDENTSKLKQEKEIAEQNLFELLENKVSQESFSLENSFFNRFLKSNLEHTGESTPIVFQKCIANNPKLLHLVSNYNQTETNNDVESCRSECTECCSDACSTVSSCCSCKTVEPATPQVCQNKNKRKEVVKENSQIDNNCQTEVDTEHEAMKANMEEMNSKLIATSELLKERLRELEDEIETFRTENTNLNKLKEEVDMERQKFYEEKNTFEQKFHEEKILSEYYLAEEKERLNKQKQMYERYVREMRGRLNKKEKDEVTNLKQEICNLKEEIRVKDAKSTSTIARLRNQLKIIEKQREELQNEVEKLKKENRRIKHSNDITRRMTNMKYLEQINKKLSNMNRDTLPEVEVNSDVKYKAFEIERQSRSRKAGLSNTRSRSKSVPNINVTSRYAKYFSQRDASSEIERNANIHVEGTDSENYELDLGLEDDGNENCDPNESLEIDLATSENNLEKIYMETFRSLSPKSTRSTKNSINNNYLSEPDRGHSPNGFFLQKSNSASSHRGSKSPSSYEVNSLNRSKSPVSVISHRSKSPVSIMSHRSNQRTSRSPVNIPNSGESNNSIKYKSPTSMVSKNTSHRSTVINKEVFSDQLAVSPEPTSSKVSLTKTNLQPTEIKKPDGSRELRFPNGNIKYISADGKYCKFVYYNGDVKENFYSEGRIKYFYAESKTYHTSHADGLEVLEFPDGQLEKRYKDGSSEVRLPNGSVRYHYPGNEHVREEWRFPDGSVMTVSAAGEKRVTFLNGQVEVHSTDHKRREFPDGTVKLVYTDGTSETRYASGRVRIKNKHGHLIMDTAPA